MNIMLLTDLEGIAGVDNIGQMDRTSQIYKNTCDLLCKSINLAVDTCFKHGAEKVYYLDGHGGGGNVNEELIDNRATKCSITEWVDLLKSGGIDCQIELGSHARAGTIGGFLDHTISSKSIFSIKINGVEMSELSLHALLASRYNVPIAAVIGDETACKQAKEYIHNIITGAVKKAYCRNEAITYLNCDEILVQTVVSALENYKKVSLYKLSLPLNVEQTYYRTDMCEKEFEKHKDVAQRVGARTLRKTVKSIEKYQDLKF